MTGQLTLKSDVYSFGVVFLELITGRKAIDNTRPAGEQNLVAWARPLFKDRRKFTKMADPLLHGHYPMRGLYQALAVAAMCLQEEATTRPLIGDVVTALSYLASQKYDPNTAHSNRSTPRARARRKTESPHKNSPDFTPKDTFKEMGIVGDSGRNLEEFDESDARNSSHYDSPMHGGRRSRKNNERVVNRERAVAEARVWGENWRERKRGEFGSFDGTNE